MNKSLLSLVVISFLMTNVALGETKPEPVIVKKDREIKIDGNLSDWKGIEPLLINRVDQVDPRMGSGKWQGPDDLSARIYAAMDDKNLYFAADITDNDPMNNIFRDNDTWQGDCVEIFFEAQDIPDTDDAGLTDTRRLNGGKTGYEYQILINPGDRGKAPQIWFTNRDSGMGDINIERIRGTSGENAIGGEISSKKTEHGYVIEAMIPLNNFGSFEPQEGMRIGFDVAISDADSPEKDRKSSMILFSARSHDELGWGKAILFARRNKKATTGTEKPEQKIHETIINVHGNKNHVINGYDSINRLIFGTELSPGNIMRSELIDFGRGAKIEFRYDDIGDMGLRVAGEKLSPDEKAKLVMDDKFWQKKEVIDDVLLDWSQEWPKVEKIANPKGLFIFFTFTPYWMEKEPVDKEGYKKFFDEHPEYSNSGLRDSLHVIMGDKNLNFSIPKDKKLYGQLCNRYLTILRKQIPPDVKIYVGLGNEYNWQSNFYSQAILNEVMESYKNSGDYAAGKAVLEEYQKLYEGFSSAIKKDNPDVMIGGMGFAFSAFSKGRWGADTWGDVVAPFIAQAKILDIYDFHNYGADFETSEVTFETIANYAWLTRGKKIRMVDSESAYIACYGSDTFFRELTQLAELLSNLRYWFTMFRHPDKVAGRSLCFQEHIFDSFGNLYPNSQSYKIMKYLKGTKIAADCSNPAVRTISSLKEDSLSTVIFNDQTAEEKILVNISAPASAEVKSVEVTYVRYDSKQDRILYGTFQPREPAGGVENVKTTLLCEPLSLYLVRAILNKPVQPTQTLKEEEYFGDKTVFEITGSKNPEETVKIKIPKEETSGIKSAELRIGYADTPKGEAMVILNEGTPFIPPGHRDRDSTWPLQWGRWSTRMYKTNIPVSGIKEENTLTFKIKSSSKMYRILFTSLAITKEEGNKDKNESLPFIIDYSNKTADNVTEQPAESYLVTPGVVRNGSFEEVDEVTKSARYWGFGYPRVIPTICTDPQKAHSGNNCVRLPGGVLTHFVLCEKGKRYRISIWYKAENPVQSFNVGVHIVTGLILGGLGLENIKTPNGYEYASWYAPSQAHQRVCTSASVDKEWREFWIEFTPNQSTPVLITLWSAEVAKPTDKVALVDDVKCEEIGAQ